MLHALIDFAHRQGLAAEPGFGPQTLHWAIQTDRDGRFLDRPLIRLGPDGKGRALPSVPFLAADEIKNQSEAGIGCQAFWEDAEKLLLWTDGPPKESVLRRHRNFLRLLEEAAGELEEAAAVLRLLRDESFRPAAIAILNSLSAPKPKRTDRMSFRVDGTLLVDSAAVTAWWRGRYARFRQAAAGRKGAGEAVMADLLTGALVAPARTHPTKIKGLGMVGGRGMGDALISFDKEAFGSYGLEQSANAAMSAESVKLYAEALNHLIADRGRVLAKMLVVPWFKEAVPAALDPNDAVIGGDDDTEEPAPLPSAYANPDPAVAAERLANAKAARFLKSYHSGELEPLKDNLYYALTLSGASGRVMVRDWMEGRFPDLAKAVVAWFDDLSIVRADGAALAQPPKFKGVLWGMVRDLRDAPAPLIAALWRAAVRGEPIPATAHARALARARIAFLAGEMPRMAGLGLLKAFHLRSGDRTMMPYLNPDHPDPAYHCGRLLAVLASLQRTALGDVGAGVVQRFYVAFSQTPALVFGRLIGNAKNHLNKLDPGTAFRIEEAIAEITGRLQDGLPETLQLAKQSLFALGYYQQLAYQRAQAAERSAARKAKAAKNAGPEDPTDHQETDDV